ncbi:hypothetical protein [Hyphomicrobium zavarzinii]|uniref:hypothetical protein n=1 Tax=Hyphomicrobium zavarzinii TaxID=48292 RepID=UPI0012EB31EA|nr:hypothetical protein [Hyphomicrobium zavarzinii]
MTMQTDIAELSGSTVLGGALPGQALFTKLAALARSGPSIPTGWLWNMQGVEVVSPSFARESFVSIRALLRAQRSNLVPVIVNANPDVREDLALTLKTAQSAILSCTRDSEGKLNDFELIGDLDAHLQATFDLVAERGETDAKELKELTDARPGSAPIVQTAWNNRLAKLVELGALIEIPHGRSKRYRPVI